MNKIIIEPDKVEEYKSGAIENICKNIANKMDLKVFKEQQELTKMWKEKYYQMKEEKNKQKEVIDKILKLKRYTSLMEYDEEFVKVKDILELLEEIE